MQRTEEKVCTRDEVQGWLVWGRETSGGNDIGPVLRVWQRLHSQLRVGQWVECFISHEHGVKAERWREKALEEFVRKRTDQASVWEAGKERTGQAFIQKAGGDQEVGQKKGMWRRPRPTGKRSLCGCSGDQRVCGVDEGGGRRGPP
eukprot:EG_transcript_42580